jgi:hypothetical protein
MGDNLVPTCHARFAFNWRATHAHLATALRLASVSAFVIPAFLPAVLRFPFTCRCFFVAAAFFARLFAIHFPPSSRIQSSNRSNSGWAIL